MQERPRIACYLRSSTESQTVDHQHNDVNQWAESRGIDPQEVDRYVDVAESGADPGRREFNKLIDRIETGVYDYVIIWEVSRLARLGSAYQRFFEIAEESDTIVAITDGWIDEVKPDGTGKLIADISAAVAEEERRRLIKRVNAGISQARREGKWLGQVPVGFERNDEGYLRPNLNPAEGEDGFLEIRDALLQIEKGESYRAAAKTVHTTRQSLARIHQDPERFNWYFNGEADESRVDEALRYVELF